jgi:hypothetical protein
MKADTKFRNNENREEERESVILYLKSVGNNVITASKTHGASKFE